MPGLWVGSHSVQRVQRQSESQLSGGVDDEDSADSVWWTDDPMPPIEDDTFEDIYRAYAGHERTLSEAEYDVLLAAYESTNPPVNGPASASLPGG